MSPKILASAKAYVSLIGAMVTALVGVTTPDTQTYHVLTIILALATAFLTWVTPNAGSTK